MKLIPRTVLVRGLRTALQVFVAFILAFIGTVMVEVAGAGTLRAFADMDMLDKAAFAGVMSALVLVVSLLQNYVEVKGWPIIGRLPRD